METPEEILDKCGSYLSRETLIKLIIKSQKKAYNQAITDAVNSAKITTVCDKCGSFDVEETEYFLHCVTCDSEMGGKIVVNPQTILRLLR